MGKKTSKQSGRVPMSEEEKKKKFGDNYDPNYKKDKRRQEPRTNNPQWYYPNEQLLRDIASIPYNRIPGTKWQLNVTNASSAGTITKQSNNVINGSVMTIHYTETPGQSVFATSGANMAAVKLYTYVRQRNSGARNYAAADAMMYILAMRDIYGCYAYLKKLIGLAGWFDAENRNLPDLLIRASGCDPIDLRTNIAQYRGRLNLIASKINAFAVPKYFKAFDRAVYIAGNVFADSSSIRGQYYLYVKDACYKWNPTASETGTQLTCTGFVNSGYTTNTFNTYLVILDSLVEALFLDDDANTISGDILKAFGDRGLYNVAEVGEDYVTVPVFDEDQLNQIENSIGVMSAMTSGSVTDYPGLDINNVSALNIDQDTQLIKFTPTFSTTRGATTVDQVVFNSHKDEPSPADNIEWSRNMTLCTLTKGSNSNATVTVDCFGLEIIWGFGLHWYNYSGTTNVGGWSHNAWTQMNMTVTTNLDLAIEYFDWHPIRYLCATGSNPSAWIGGDIKKATIITKLTLQRMHELAAFSAFWNDELYTSVNS